MGWSPDEDPLLRYVVTGAAGFIGSRLADLLQEAGHEVVGVDCFTDYYDAGEKEENAAGLDVRRFDLADTELELDLARRQARVDDRIVDLSAREFRLLYHLVAHAGEVVSRERLLSEVWGYSFDPGSNVVDVCVRRLRTKLGAPSPIETVRHAGYRLAA